MTDEKSESRAANKSSELAERIDAKAKRIMKSRRRRNQAVWLGMGMMGLIGWSVTVPTLAGAAIGIWLDKNYPGSHSWTLALLVSGLAIGCLNAWHWVAKEEAAMRDEEDNQHE
ncbi:MAG: AtpZ/AtpI family protein [Planctomycetaceae bacterium]|nr:AtpZ/AtpI family protein [Planctomycetaceae bacterium]